MIKKILFLIICTFATQAFASETINLPYKNIKNGDKITVSEDGQSWFLAKKKSSPILIKNDKTNSSNYIELYSKDGEYSFFIDSQYTFLNKNALIGYSNSNLKFYEYTMNNKVLSSRELSKEEVCSLFKKYKIITLSDFSSSTNSLKIKKRHSDLNLIILNDTERSFDGYQFSSNNAEFETFQLKSFLKVTKRGMIQFSHTENSSKDYPWFVLLVR
jgi:hypothetical protein